MLKPLIDGIIVKSIYVIEDSKVTYSWPTDILKHRITYFLKKTLKGENRSAPSCAIILDFKSKTMYFALTRNRSIIVFKLDLSNPLELVFLKIQIILSIVYPSYKVFN
ncbi:MAG: hypothetical protein DRO23_12315 [Thermoprotei archaeon]|nr:MAG: hypothetical protein DRO23_12315 [Thermoprotei archaeon]